jgi:hypothetical protein
MYKLVFQNSKFALIFAVMTIISAVSMVGSPEDEGVVGRAAALAENARANKADGAPPPARSSLFGEYVPGGEGEPATPDEAPEAVSNAPIPLEPLK